ncbi:hypothetical protein [Microbulbifer yueqingensis]|uniref:hypothetical protein n=1 Tax=Microbulbifer yueqingensis TaxID=658219 RepID=UPI001113E530|nr:hypothetical protein [Microbulbifer yueqingensis]
MKALLVNLVGLAGSWHLMDVSSDSALRAGVAPVIFVFFLISGLAWLTVQFGRNPGGGRRTYVIADSSGYLNVGDGGSRSGKDSGGSG